AGRIELEIDRRPKKKQTIIRVIDWAEGMTDADFEKCVGSYGDDTSGQVGRGVFGMGLKDTINAFGEGTITSFKNGAKYHCTLKDVDDLSLHPARSITSADRKEFQNASRGTVVEIVVKNPKVKIPQIDNLRLQLQTHVCLRGIMSDPSRTVVLRNLRAGNADPISYEFPEGEALLDNLRLPLSGFPSLEATLTVKRANGPESLEQVGSFRTGGILITSRRTIHEATLFGYDDDPHAARLFGELRCDALYDLQAQGEPVVDKNRSGLRKDHELTKLLFAAAKCEIEKLVTAERQRERRERETLEKEETKRRFRDAVKSLNEMAKNELQIGGLGAGDGPMQLEARTPEDGLEFIPDSYRVLLGERTNLKLRVRVDGVSGISVGDRVEVSCDNAHIHILDDRPLVPRLFSEEPPLALVHVQIEGIQANAQGLITAKCKAKTAIAMVEVVSTRSQKEHTPSGGLFKEIKYEEHPDTPVRAHFDRKEGLIWINTRGPSVDLYFGPGGEGQDLPANQVLVAELVTELSCQEIARRKNETKTLDIPPGIDDLEAFNRELEKLKATYAPLIHKALVAPQARRTM
ncbi:MAG TPA: hypothetical protein VII58_06430, partial [Acidobacteriaceae bacterium]